MVFRKGQTLEEMHFIHPHCYWCGIKTTLPKKGGTVFYTVFKYGKSIDRNYNLPHCATRDHLFPRELMSSRMADQERNGGTSTVVLACDRCNNIRSQIQHRLFGDNQQKVV